MEKAPNPSPQESSFSLPARPGNGKDDSHDGSGVISGSQESKKRNPPTPEELVAHYEAQGLEYKDASLRVIQELQGILYQTTFSGRRKKDKFMGETLRKLDTVNTRLAILESKLDRKPGFTEAISIGLVSGAFVPLVLSELSHIWSGVSSAFKSDGSHPPSP